MSDNLLLTVIARSIGRTTMQANQTERAADVLRSVKENDLTLPQPTNLIEHEITRLRTDLTKAEHIIAAYELVSVQRGADLHAAITQANHAEADLAVVTEERDRMREALKPFADAADDFIAEKHDAHRAIVTLGDLRRARAALEGVTKKEGEGNE